jgi:hypothetical protein
MDILVMHTILLLQMLQTFSEVVRRKNLMFLKLHLLDLVIGFLKFYRLNNM